MFIMRFSENRDSFEKFKKFKGALKKTFIQSKTF